MQKAAFAGRRGPGLLGRRQDPAPARRPRPGSAASCRPLPRPRLFLRLMAGLGRSGAAVFLRCHVPSTRTHILRLGGQRPQGPARLRDASLPVPRGKLSMLPPWVNRFLLPRRHTRAFPGAPLSIPQSLKRSPGRRVLQAHGGSRSATRLSALRGLVSVPLCRRGHVSGVPAR